MKRVVIGGWLALVAVAAAGEGAYERRSIEGRTVMVERRLLAEEPDLAARGLALLAEKLRDMHARLPAAGLDRVAHVRIWVSLDAEPGAAFHPSRRWLEEHGRLPEMAGDIEIQNIRHFIDWSGTQPMVIPHEMAHAFHFHVYGFGNRALRRAYERAKAAGLYDAVRHANGRLQRAYAMKNEKEYFAELTEAAYGRNDFYPFNREELARHDPEGLALVEACWNLRALRDARQPAPAPEPPAAASAPIPRAPAVK